MPQLQILTQALVVLVLMFSLASCGTPAFKPGMMRTASVDPVMKMPKQMAFSTAGSQWAMGTVSGLGGLAALPLAAAVGSATQPERGMAMDEFVRVEMTKALTEEINQTGRLSIVPAGQGEGRVSVQLWVWGFIAHPFTGKLRANMSGKVSVLDARGKPVWSCLVPNAYNPELKSIPQFKRADLEHNTAAMQRDLARQARLLARDVRRHMTGEK
jgi:hypothetical protein